MYRYTEDHSRFPARQRGSPWYEPVFYGIELFKNFSFKQQPLKNSKMRSILQDLFNNQPGY
jgi:hypothetical protein